MNVTKLFAGSVSATALALLALTAASGHGAPPTTPMVLASPGVPSAAATAPAAISDRRLANQLLILDRAMDVLQRARDDYYGDRAHAITALNKAREDLRNALKADNQDEPSDQRVPKTPIESAAGSENGSMAASNDRLADVRSMLDRVIANLKADNRDYGGFRAKAVADVQQARDSITDALRQANGGAGNGSDRSIGATNALVLRAIDTLQGAQADYDGHRVAAINALNAARADLAAALKVDNSAESATNAAAATTAKPGEAEDNSRAASNQRLRDARAMVVTAIDNLKADSHDYGGYRVKAVADLTLAQSELDKALAAASR